MPTPETVDPDARSIRHSIVYPHPIERVWRVIATQDGLEKWLMKNDFQPKLGHRFRFSAKPVPGWRGWTECEVLTLDPPQNGKAKLIISWDGGNLPTLVTFTLAAEKDGTRLTFEHVGLAGFRGFLMYLGMKNGWGRMFNLYIPGLLGALVKGEFDTFDPKRDCVE